VVQAPDELENLISCEFLALAFEAEIVEPLQFVQTRVVLDVVALHVPRQPARSANSRGPHHLERDPRVDLVHLDGERVRDPLDLCTVIPLRARAAGTLTTRSCRRLLNWLQIQLYCVSARVLKSRHFSLSSASVCCSTSSGRICSGFGSCATTSAWSSRGRGEGTEAARR
jgi:hypothetical protein